MKLWVIIICLALTCFGIAEAAIDAKHECSHPACLEGTDINYTVVIQNNLKDNIVVDDVYIKDIETGQLLAIDARKARIIPPNATDEFFLASSVKSPLQGYTLYYVPCFQAQAFNQKRSTGFYEVCGTIIKSLTVVPLNQVECRTDEECNQTSYCNTRSLYKCRTLGCLGNQTIQNHQCADLACSLLQYPAGNRCFYNKAVFLGIIIILVILTALLLFGLGKPRRKRR